MASGRYNFDAGDRPTAVDWQDMLGDQVVFQYATAAARDADIPPAKRKEGMVTIQKDDDEFTLCVDGVNWVSFGKYGAWRNITNLGLFGSTTNPTLGSGPTQKARYNRIGSFATVHVFLKFGSSGMAAGTGMYEIEIPALVPPNSNLYGAEEFIIGSGMSIIGGVRKPMLAKAISATRFRLIYGGLSGDVTEANAGAWANGDVVFNGVLIYECV